MVMTCLESEGSDWFQARKGQWAAARNHDLEAELILPYKNRLLRLLTLVYHPLLLVRQPPGVTTCDQYNIQVGWFGPMTWMMYLMNGWLRENALPRFTSSSQQDNLPRTGLPFSFALSHPLADHLLVSSAPHPSENVIQVCIQVYGSCIRLFQPADMTILTHLQIICHHCRLW